jgi:two-component system, LytTR family, sensor kinase
MKRPFVLFNILILSTIPVITGILFSFTLNLIFGEFSPRIFSMVIINTLFLGGGAILTYIIAKQLLLNLNPALILLICFSITFGVSFTGFIYIFLNDPFLFIVEGEKTIIYLFINFLFILALITAVTGNLVYQKRLSEKEKSIMEERILRAEMEKKVLVSQVNPHFLFNSLNLSVSLLENPDMAEKVLIKLSGLLRYSLDAVKQEKVPLTEELAQVENYLSIQKLRFENRLNYEITGQGAFLVPPFILQPLVENSIKHHIRKKKPLSLYINIKQEKDSYIITLYDSYKEIDKSMIGRGIGLLNVKKRIELAGGNFNIRDGGINIVFKA